MTRRTLVVLAGLAALLAAPLAAEARHSCGSSTRTEGNCTITTTTLCDYRTVNGKRQEYIVGTQTSKSCTVPDKAQVRPNVPLSSGTLSPVSPVKPPRAAPVGPLRGPIRQAL